MHEKLLLLAGSVTGGICAETDVLGVICIEKQLLLVGLLRVCFYERDLPRNAVFEMN